MFEHAKTLDTRWGLGLAFIDTDDENLETLSLRVWAPIADDGGEAYVDVKLGLSGDASIEAHDQMSLMNRQALIDMTPATFEQAMEAAGVAQLLDDAYANYPQG